MSNSDTQRMRTPHEELMPRVLGRAILMLMATALLVTTFAVLSERPLEAQPPESAIVTNRVLYLTGDMSGAAQVHDETGGLVADLDATEGGFVSGITRVLDRERTKHRVPLDGPIHLIRTENGRVSVYDPSTEWRADLMGFGADNARAFARLLDQP